MTKLGFALGSTSCLTAGHVRMHMLMDVVGGQASEEQGADARAERTVIPAVRMRGADPEVMAAAGCEGKEGDQRQDWESVW